MLLAAISKGKISTRPKSMMSMAATFWKLNKPAKLPIEPTSPKPGPTLPMQAMEAVREVLKSMLSAKTIVPRAMTRI